MVKFRFQSEVVTPVSGKMLQELFVASACVDINVRKQSLSDIHATWCAHQLDA